MIVENRQLYPAKPILFGQFERLLFRKKSFTIILVLVDWDTLRKDGRICKSDQFHIARFTFRSAFKSYVYPKTEPLDNCKLRQGIVAACCSF